MYGKCKSVHLSYDKVNSINPHHKAYLFGSRLRLYPNFMRRNEEIELWVAALLLNEDQPGPRVKKERKPKDSNLYEDI